MKEFNYSPLNELFKGTVKLKIPSFKERMALAKDLGIADLKDKMSGENLEESLEQLEGMMDKVKEFIISMDLSCGEEKFKSLDDLQYYKEGMELFKEIIQVIGGGIPLGKN